MSTMAAHHHRLCRRLTRMEIRQRTRNVADVFAWLTLQLKEGDVGLCQKWVDFPEGAWEDRKSPMLQLSVPLYVNNSK